MLSNDIAICIRTVDYSETSQIVTLFTRDHGKVDAIAKGAKRAKSVFGGPLDIFSFGKIVFSDSQKGLSTLTEFEGKCVFWALRQRLFNLNGAFFAAELLTKFTHDHDKAPERVQG